MDRRDSISGIYGTACVAALLLLVQGCTAIRDVTEPHEGGRYAVGDAATAHVGEVMLDRFRYTAAPVALPLVAIPAASGRLAVPVGTRLVGRKVDDERAYCTPMGSDFACFYDADGDRSFDHVLVSNTGIVSSKQVLNPAVPYSLGEGTQTRGFKSELVYEGLSGNVITLRYLDYTDDLTRPTYDQSLLFTLLPNGPTEINYRSARLKILQADDQIIRYEILSDFEG